ncbi:MAG: glycosyltransferase family 4 protein [Kiritimatiellae bacterium]|nr:glycosyltransferase family 4 protein [Kiritimatiellia bacterium]
MKPIPVAVFDTRWIPEHPSGVGVYALELARRLPALLPRWRFVFLAADGAARGRLAAALPEGADIRVAGCGPLSPRSQLRLPRLLRALGADLYHAPNFMVPYRAFRRGGGGRVRCVATIHDAIPLVVPDYAPRSRTSRMKALYRWCLRETALRADALFTVSETSRRDVLRALALPPEAAARVRAVHNGVDPAFRADGRAPVRAADDPAERVLLYVGRRDPYKNVSMLVEAFAAARAAAPFPVRLVVAGPRDPRYPEAENAARALGVADAVDFTGSLGFAELAALYRRADLLVHPSRYEGFGLQIAEAFASGLPVLCTDGGAAPETAGDAARVVPLAGGAAAFADAILALLRDPARLARLREAGLRRAPLFTWERTAAAVAAAYGD